MTRKLSQMEHNHSADAVFPKLEVKTVCKNYKVSLWRIIDLTLFAVLLIFVLLFRLQVVFAWIDKYNIRETLYIYLYLRLVFFYRIRLNKNLLWIYMFLLSSVFVGGYTYLLYGQEMAIKGFTRFVNVALLAPLSAVLFTSFKQIKIFFNIWIIIGLLGAITAGYQFMGGDLSCLTLDYVAERGHKTRFMTLLGEPNVGGMVSVLMYIFAMLMPFRFIYRLIILLFAMVLMILSLSKAALLGFLLATFLMLALYQKLMFRTFFIKKAGLAIGILMTVFVLTSSLFNFQQSFKEYSVIFVKSLVNKEKQIYRYGVLSDLCNRLFVKGIKGIELAKRESDCYLLNCLAGSTFGIAGSAAKEIRGKSSAILPHNGFLEIYLVGGIFMLLIFLAILFFTCKRLYNVGVTVRYYKTLWIGFLMLIAFLFIYPITYQPILGAIFWLIVGIAANRAVEKSVLKTVY